MRQQPREGASGGDAEQRTAGHLCTARATRRGLHRVQNLGFRVALCTKLIRPTDHAQPPTTPICLA
eukprot:365588-Chlamydomonas_euryale.AAC.6